LMPTFTVVAKAFHDAHPAKDGEGKRWATE